jgi:leader peptidase (prepilin peptidase)/N-methyltransferase
VEFGRLIFGRQKITFQTPSPVSWTRDKDTAELIIEGETLDWSSLFPRGTETVLMEYEDAQLDGLRVPESSAVWHFESVRFGQRVVDLNVAKQFTARLRFLVLPREVMGYGDVKFLAAIGAFTGWKAVFFTLMAGSMAGALLGVIAIASGRREASGRIPFGPYLALGALLWLAVGEDVWTAYWSLLRFGTGETGPLP